MTIICDIRQAFKKKIKIKNADLTLVSDVLYSDSLHLYKVIRRSSGVNVSRV